MDKVNKVRNNNYDLINLTLSLKRKYTFPVDLYEFKSFEIQRLKYLIESFIFDNFPLILPNYIGVLYSSFRKKFRKKDILYMRPEISLSMKCQEPNKNLEGILNSLKIKFKGDIENVGRQ